MAWIITRDRIADPAAKPGTNSNAVGVCGPGSYEGDFTECVHKFRMLDDDGEVYYDGLCDSCDDENALGPLDDFGEPNAGCTTIQYFVKGKGWENLN